ncbi:MAG: zeta toxin family protein [Aridibacter sp.]
MEFSESVKDLDVLEILDEISVELNTISRQCRELGFGSMPKKGSKARKYYEDLLILVPLYTNTTPPNFRQGYIDEAKSMLKRMAQHLVSLKDLKFHRNNMEDERVYNFNILSEVQKYFDDSSTTTGGQPSFVLLAGGVCAGKTYIRRQKYSDGYVLVDAAEIFLSLSRGEYFEFGEVFEEPLEIIGSIVARQAIKERRNIVTEIIGASAENNRAIIDAVNSIGYKTEIIALTCDLEDAIQRNMNRGDDNISAHYTEPYHLRWILDAAAEYKSANH